MHGHQQILKPWDSCFCSSFPSNKRHLSIKITHWASAVIDFQVRSLHQLLCSTLPLLASNYTPGTFIWYPCVVQLETSLSLHTAVRVSVTHSENAATGSGSLSTSRGIWRTSTQCWWIPCVSPHLLLAPQALPSNAVACGWMGAEMLTDATTTRIPKNFPSSPPVLSSLVSLQCWETVQTTKSLCKWLSLQVPFWLSVWKQNSVAKHYLFFMSLLLLCQGTGINFGRYIEKISFCVSFLQSRIK